MQARLWRLNGGTRATGLQHERHATEPAYHMSDNTFQPGQPSATGYLQAEGGLYNGPDTPYDNASPTIDAFQEHFPVFGSALDLALDPAIDDLSFQTLLLQTPGMPHASLPQPAARQIPARQAALSVKKERLWAALGLPIQDTSSEDHFVFDTANRDGPQGRRSSVHEHDKEYQ